MSRRGPGSNPSRGFFLPAQPYRAAGRRLNFGLPHVWQRFDSKLGIGDHGRAILSEL
jgi:hypothetical protein